MPDPEASEEQARYRGLLEAAPDAMIVVNRDGLIVSANPRATSQFGYEPDELVGQSVTSIIPDGFESRLRSNALRSIGDAQAQDIETGRELIGRRKDGSSYPIHIMLSRHESSAGVIVTAAIRAVTERAEVALNSIGDGVGCTDREGHITFLNSVAEHMTGWPWNEALGRPMGDVIKIVDATTHRAIADLTKRAISGDTTVHLPANTVLVRRDGEEFPVEDSTAPMRDGAGHVTGAVIVFRDVSAARAVALQIVHQAQHDFLTGLPNRMLLEDRISQAISAAPRHRGQLAVLYLDLDGFKAVNDTLGHPVGDRLLQVVAERLTECVRASDTVSRQGGDEFVVLVSEAARSGDARTIARRMLAAIAGLKDVDGHEIAITVSIGVAVFPGDGRDADTLIKHADLAMYRVKAQGRAGFEFFDPKREDRQAPRPAAAHARRSNAAQTQSHAGR